MRDKRDSLLLPLLSVVIGGLLAILSGVVAAQYAGRAELSLDREKYERERLERAYLLLLEADDWATFEMHRAASERRWPEPEAVKDTSREAIMLIRLYAPELSTDTENLAKARSAFTASLFRYWQVLEASSAQSSSKSVPASPGESGLNELRSAKLASDSFKQQVQTLLRKLETCLHARMGMKAANPADRADGRSAAHRQ